MKEAIFMRLFVMFDLPTNTKRDRQYATKFRSHLIRNGFDMLQFSIYIRVCKGQDETDKYINRIKKALPPKGNVRVLQITDKQYGRMEILVGEEKITEKKLGNEQLVLF